ncbi:hypothetical protein [Clavibacter michiganensis]|uniref:hypothetical protein n=1 Tax=Clavibacter michiganensis TaxID=28447 RepID=UPI0029306954|nr:hypothetical protein [Clavibacter michiganensis]
MIRTSIRPTDGTRRRSLRGRAAVGLATATTAVLLLAGCAGSSTPEDRALDDLQQRTLSVTQSSADGVGGAGDPGNGNGNGNGNG